LGRVGDITLNEHGQPVLTLSLTNYGSTVCAISGEVTAELKINNAVVDTAKLSVTRTHISPQETIKLQFVFNNKLQCTGRVDIRVPLSGEEWARSESRGTLSCPV